MRDDPCVTDLVTRARIGDQQAWDALVEQHAPLVWSQDVGQIVWLRLVDHLGNLRDPAALAGWLATTTRRECAWALRAAGRPALTQVCDTENIPDNNQYGIAERELLIHERNAALRQAFRDLPPDSQRLLALLIADPPLSHTQISATLGIPVGSIGPSSGRCLAKLRHHPAIAALISPDEPNRRLTASVGQLKVAARLRSGLRPLPSSRTRCTLVWYQGAWVGVPRGGRMPG